MRYIDADKFMDRLNYAQIEFSDTYAGLGRAKFLLSLQPTADVEEVRHGEWQYEQLDEYKFYKVTCPYCDAYYMGNYDAYNEPDEFNYCPNCGAKMDGERKENA